MSTDTEKSDATPSAPELPKSTVNAITKFVAEHGGSARAVIQPVGLAGVRITLVGLGSRKHATNPETTCGA